MPNSCTKCKRSVKGHEGPCGANCTLAPLPPEEQQDGSSEDVSEVEYSAEELRALLEAEEQKQQRLREQVEVRELKQKMAALKMSNEVLQEQLKKGSVGSEHISENRRGTSSESVVVTACEASKSEVNINSLRNIPEVAASAAALLNAYFPNLEGQNSALTGSVGFTQRSCTTPQTVMTPSVSRAMPNRGMGGLTGYNIQDLHRPTGQGQQYTIAGQGSGMVQNAATGYSSEQFFPSFLGQQSSIQFSGHEGNVSSSRVKSGADLVYRENFKSK